METEWSEKKQKPQIKNKQTENQKNQPPSTPTTLDHRLPLDSTVSTSGTLNVFCQPQLLLFPSLRIHSVFLSSPSQSLSYWQVNWILLLSWLASLSISSLSVLLILILSLVYQLQLLELQQAPLLILWIISILL